MITLMLCFVLLAGLAGCGSDSALAQVKQATEAVRRAGSLSAELKIERTNPDDKEDNLSFSGFLDVENALTNEMTVYLDLPSSRVESITYPEGPGLLPPVGYWVHGYWVEFSNEPDHSNRREERWVPQTKHILYYRGGELFFANSRSRVNLTGLDPLPALRAHSLPADGFESVGWNSDAGRISFAVKPNSALHRQLNALCAALFGEALDSISAPSGTLTLDADGRPKSLTLEFTDLFPPEKGPHNYSLTMDNFRYPGLQPVKLPADLDDYTVK